MTDRIQDFVIARAFNAPRGTVWKAWTEADRLKQWFGPKGFTMISCKLDLRPGGLFHYCMRVPDGKEMWGRFLYREIVSPERIVWVNSFSDKKGGVTRHPWSADWPLELLTTVTLTEQKGQTTATVRWSPINPTEIERKAFNERHSSMTQGWTGTFDQLTDYLAKTI